MSDLCAFPHSLPAQALDAAARPASASCRRPRPLALLLSAGLHALALGLLFATTLDQPAPSSPPVVEVRFVEIAGPTGGGGGAGEGGRTAAIEPASPPGPSRLSRPASPARAIPARAPARPAAIATETSPRPKPKPMGQAAPPAALDATSPPASQASASIGTSTGTSIGTSGGPAGGAAPGKAGSGSGSGGGAGTGVGWNSGPGSGQGGVAVDRMPAAVRRVKPVYPMAARRRGLNGRVVLRLYVDEHGGVREVRVQSAEPAGMFEAQAVAAARRWRFTPAMAHGEPVGMWMTLPVRFTLDGR